MNNKAKVVAGSKALHHLLPELVVPIDREYTQLLFGWHAPEFQNKQAKCFEQAFRAFVGIARATQPVQYVGASWNTCRTKVIDNAIVGLICLAKAQLRSQSTQLTSRSIRRP